MTTLIFIIITATTNISTNIITTDFTSYDKCEVSAKQISSMLDSGSSSWDYVCVDK